MSSVNVNKLYNNFCEYTCIPKDTITMMTISAGASFAIKLIFERDLNTALAYGTFSIVACLTHALGAAILRKFNFSKDPFLKASLIAFSIYLMPVATKVNCAIALSIFCWNAFQTVNTSSYEKIISLKYNHPYILV